MIDWVIIALLAAFLFGFADFAQKILSKNFNFITLSLLAGIGDLLILVALPFVYTPLSLPVILLVSIAAILNVAAVFFFFKAISIEEASRVSPLWNIQSVFALLVGILLLNELLSSTDLLGFILIVGGSLTLTTRKLRDLYKLRPSLILMMFAGLSGGTLSVLLRMATQDASFMMVTVLFFLVNGIIALLLLATVTKFRQQAIVEIKRAPASAWQLYFVTRILVFVAFGAYILALETGPAALVVSLASLAGLFVLLFATLVSHVKPHILQEEISPTILATKIISLAALIIGVFLIS